jgi:hypothetical protein
MAWLAAKALMLAAKCSVKAGAKGNGCNERRRRHGGIIGVKWQCQYGINGGVSAA